MHVWSTSRGGNLSSRSTVLLLKRDPTVSVAVSPSHVCCNPVALQVLNRATRISEFIHLGEM